MYWFNRTLVYMETGGLSRSWRGFAFYWILFVGELWNGRPAEGYGKTK